MSNILDDFSELDRKSRRSKKQKKKPSPKEKEETLAELETVINNLMPDKPATTKPLYWWEFGQILIERWLTTILIGGLCVLLFGQGTYYFVGVLIMLSVYGVFLDQLTDQAARLFGKPCFIDHEDSYYAFIFLLLSLMIIQLALPHNTHMASFFNVSIVTNSFLFVVVGVELLFDALLIVLLWYKGDQDFLTKRATPKK